MPTLALEDPHDRAAPVVTFDTAAGRAPSRPIIWAGALSASLHALLLLTIGLAGFHSSRPGPAPELSVNFEATDGPGTEHAMAGPVESPAAPISRKSEEVLASLAGSRSPVLRPAPRREAPDVPTAPDAAAGDSTASTVDTAPDANASSGPAHGDSPPEEGAVLTTAGASDREVPAQAEASAQQHPGIAVASAQEPVLERWIVQAAQGLQDANLTQATLSLRHQGHQYTAFLARRPAADEMDVEHVNAEITTEENGKRVRTLLQLKRLAFSSFTQLVDYWDTGVQFHDDEIEGRFHSNSEIVLGYDRIAPRFLGKVTTAAWRIANATGRRAMREIFRGGLETRSGRIELPANFPRFASYPGDSSPKTHAFTRPTRVTFYSDGSYGWRELGANAPEQRQAVSLPQYIVGSRGTTLCVRGTVRGKIVVYSPERIVVEGSLLYAHDPRSSPDADDYLGLISGKDVEIAPQKVTGPGDLEIQAAVYARRRFVVSDLDARGTATLMIRGSLTAGSLTATEPRYATRYDFDQRFERLRPPGFPVTNRYEVEAWDGQWREAEADAPAAPPEAAPVSTSPPQG